MLSKTSTMLVNAVVELAKLADGKSEGAASIAKKNQSSEKLFGQIITAVGDARITSFTTRNARRFSINQRSAKNYAIRYCRTDRERRGMVRLCARVKEMFGRKSMSRS